jgi:hypothetical protein
VIKHLSRYISVIKEEMKELLLTLETAIYSGRNFEGLMV